MTEATETVPAGTLAKLERMREALRKARNQVVAFSIPQIGAEAAVKSVAYIDAALEDTK